MKSEYEVFSAIRKDFDAIAVPSLSLFIEKRFGTWIPDFSLFQYNKCVCIIEAKNNKPSRQGILKYINQCRIARSKYEIGSFVIAYPEDNNIIYLDCTDAVLSHDRDIACSIDEILQFGQQELFAILSTYCSLEKGELRVSDVKEKKSRSSFWGISMWLFSIVVAVAVLAIDVLNTPNMSWERLCLVALILVFSALQFIEKASIRKDGIELYTVAHDGKRNGIKPEDK